MTIYDRLRSETQKLAQTVGSELQLQKVFQEDYNPRTGKSPEPELQIHDFSGVLETNPQSAKSISPSFSLQSGDIVVIVPEGSLLVSIEVRDLIILDGESYRIIAVDPPYDDPTVVIRQVQIRQKGS